jgi:putative transposase
MHQRSTHQEQLSIPTWETLHTWLRGWMQELVQWALEAEVTELLGRVRYQRRAEVDGVPGYRNGYGKPRKLTTPVGTVTLRRPRVRGLEERFVSRILPLFARRTKEVGELLPELYLHGLAEGDFDLALRGLLGEEAPLSASTVARLKEQWQAEWEAWRRRRLDDLEPVYLWADGVYVRAGLEKEKAAVLVVVVGCADGRKVVVSVEPGARESVETWSRVLRDLRDRGLRAPRLVIADGHLGIWGAVRNIWPEADEQRCWNHKILNVLDQVPKTQQPAARRMLREVMYAPTQAEAERKRQQFEAWAQSRGYRAAAETLGRDWDRMVTLYRYPREHWVHIRTVNVVESPFAALRLRTDAAKRFKRSDRATAVIWKMLLVAERRFRRLNAPHLLAKVYAGVRYVDGVEATQEVAA